MNGAVIPNTPIAVDFWRVRRCPHSRIFFLSHMHADHTAGLTSSWNSYTIYCSVITKKLLTAKLHVKSELVVGLPLYEPVTINLDEVGRETMTVTLVDANHCPGSVMFIFEGYFGRILYTGDFRFCDRLLKYSAIKGKQFDTLYLDNTYCHPKCFFPTRSNATTTVVEIIRNHPQHTIVIGLHSLGKETLLYDIAVACKCWIGMDPSRSETMELVGMPQVFTCDVDSTRIRVVSFQEVNKRNIDLWNSKEPTIAILPTCLYVGGSNPYENVPNVFVVPYSDHSSFEELKAFVSDIRPRKIIPIVHKHRLSADENPNSRVNMNIFQSLMEPSSSQKFSVPPSVECFMAPEMKQDVKKRMKATTKLGIRKVAKSRKACGVVFLPSQEECEEQKFCGWANGDFEDKENTDSERGDGVAKEIDIQERHDSMFSPMKNDRESGSGVFADNKGVAINDNSRDKVGSVYFILKEGFEVNENIREFSNEQMLEESNIRESSLAFFCFKQVDGSREKEGDRIDKDEEILNELSSECTTFADLKDVCSGRKRIENDIAGIEDTHEDGNVVGSSLVQRGHAEKRRRIDEGTDCKDATKAEELRSTETSLIKQCSFVISEAIKECRHNDFVSGAEENKENNERCAFASPSVRNIGGFSENEKNVVKPEETNIFSSMRIDSCSSKKRRVGDQDGVEKVETNNAQEEHKVDSSPMRKDHFRKRVKMDNDDKDITIAGDSDGEGSKHSDLDDQVDDFGCANETSDDELFAVASCYQRDYASRVCQQDERITSIKKSFSDNQGSKKKRFNMYTGQTCDFARKLLKDMVRNGSL
ncbi:uncharacterized protein LOC141879157 [Acropora palmata]|uniref:uncharacterized protein LOC141879157 n=1 Tax=Acropora palmata TaxID=6131 RepID=UPI003D9FC4A7